MKKVKTRCWKTVAECSDGTRQTLLFTVPDFGDATKLYICSNCGVLLAVNPEEEFYTKRYFMAEKQSLHCPECRSSLTSVLAYPENYLCDSTRQIEKHELGSSIIPPDKESVVVEVWNPLS